MTRYISPADTNKAIRAALKEAFPGVKFSVRSNGNATHVHWTDGPASRDVENATAQFQSKGAMDMTDYVPSIDHVVDGEKVHYLVDYVFTDRGISEAAMIGLCTEIIPLLDPTEGDSLYDQHEVPGRIVDEYRRAGIYLPHHRLSIREMARLLSEARATKK